MSANLELHTIFRKVADNNENSGERVSLKYPNCEMFCHRSGYAIIQSTHKITSAEFDEIWIDVLFNVGRMRESENGSLQ